jgi:hypothetical protein
VTQINTPVTIGVLANDSDPDSEALTITDFSQGANGTVTLDNNATPGDPQDDVLEYVPGEFSGLDTFTYTIADPTGNTALAAVTVFVNAPPVAIGDTVVTNQDTPVTIDVLANDFDSEGPLDPASVVVETEPANGTTIVNTDGTVTYTPDSEFTGADTFTYTITDTTGSIATATVTVTVNAPPVANDDTQTMINQGTGTSSVTIDVLVNDTDSDGSLEPASVAVVTGPANGTAVANGDGTVTYTPTATFFDTDTFTYTVSDNQGSSDTATVTVTVFSPPIEIRR